MAGFMYGLLYFVKKYLFSFDQKASSDSKVKVISTQTLLPKKFLSVVEFNDNIYLLGISDQSINLIDKLDQAFSENLNQAKTNTEKPNFLQLLKSNMGIK
ncbi:MAG: flagellar biosynthetic protein FliO [Ignavibacteriae bacterium]|nr:flagellar biosynthetic protein FliO [Ignavibacteriota bacterium]MCB0750734.1 flagellar biosynthetic protein FliO [Ignavibacteriota bacterium]MCB9206112.1 flagellar biosynthetic protein FliO [Ignavibacteriales bacterium]MCB9209385.1 flagellar biosynthetic protein FliO [Ignavibacteriales bacterium]MCB9258028.1 flagellar biosynthetic protein FliO [Ignavibacteriales bacterium]